MRTNRRGPRIGYPGRFVYLASPYTKWRGGVDNACARVARLAGRLIERGLVTSPIAHFHTIARAAKLDPYDHSLWLPADRPLADAAAALVVADFDGWRDSFGVGEETRWFAAAGKEAWLLDLASLTAKRL